jgi:hypothetical protein
MPNESIGCVRACIFGQLAVKGVEPTTHSSIDAAAGGGDGVDVIICHGRCGERCGQRGHPCEQFGVACHTAIPTGWHRSDARKQIDRILTRPCWSELG